MSKKHLIRTIVLNLGIIFCSSLAVADTPAPPRPYKKVVNNGRYVFVMLPQMGHHQGYSESGLYRNDGSKTPLWTVYWYAFEIDAVSDGVHLVRLGPWAGRYDQEAITFFAYGNPLRSYKINELVTFPWLMPHTVSHFTWIAGGSLNDEKLTYILTTLHGERYVFDVTTGKIISSFRYSLIVLVFSVLMLIRLYSRLGFNVCLAIIFLFCLFMSGFRSIMHKPFLIMIIVLWFSGFLLSTFLDPASPKALTRLKRLVRISARLIITFVVIVVVFFTVELSINIFQGLFAVGTEPKTSPEQRTVASIDTKGFTNSIGMEFVYIKPGTFMMGSPSEEPGRMPDEKQHMVTLSKGFFIQTTEVTQGQWKAVMDSEPPYHETLGDKIPVEGVSWYDALEFIYRLNKMEGTYQYRFPYEAEWEYACRAGTLTPFSSGKCLSSEEGKFTLRAPWAGCPREKYSANTIPVGTLKPNQWGLYDMHGNVMEWCMDKYGAYPTDHVTDYRGSPSGGYRVCRGGSYSDRVDNCRSAARFSAHPSENLASQVEKKHRSTMGFIGFRVVKTP